MLSRLALFSHPACELHDPGPLAGVLEGGYAPERIGAGLVNLLRALVGLGEAERG